MNDEEISKLSPQERAKITRRKNAEARAKRQAEQWETERKDRAATLEALRLVRDDPSSTVEQRLLAIEGIDRLQYYHFLPVHPMQQSIDTEMINARLAAHFREDDSATS